MKKLILLSVILVMVSGCQRTSNLDFSIIRGTGDTSSTMVLDYTSKKELAKTKLEIVGICDAALKFLDTGDVHTMSLPKIEAKLLKLVPPEYRSFIMGSIYYLKNRQVQIKAIGVVNLLRLRSYFEGAKRGTYMYRDAQHPIKK